MDKPPTPVPPVLPQVRQVEPGAFLHLCTCGQSAQLPDCPNACAQGLTLSITRSQRLLLCQCGRSRRLPYCDGSHSPPAPGLLAKWRRFVGRG